MISKEQSLNYHPRGATSNCYSYKPAGVLGNTIEEKTRAILGWTDTSCAYTSPTDQYFSTFYQHKPLDAYGPEKAKKRKAYCNRSAVQYPYDLANCNIGRASTSRKSSSSSVNSNTCELSSLLACHELTPPPSPVVKGQARCLPRPPPYGHRMEPEMQLPISPVSPPINPGRIEEEQKGNHFRTGASAREIFERLKVQMPLMSSEQSKFRVLLQTVANVIELETKLAQLHEETQNLSNILQEKRMQQFQQPKGNENNAYAENSQTWDNSASSISTFGPQPAAAEDVPDDLQEIDVTAFRWLVSDQSSRSQESITRDQHGFVWGAYYEDTARSQTNGQPMWNDHPPAIDPSNPLAVDTIS